MTSAAQVFGIIAVFCEVIAVCVYIVEYGAPVQPQPEIAAFPAFFGILLGLVALGLWASA